MKLEKQRDTMEPTSGVSMLEREGNRILNEKGHEVNLHGVSTADPKRISTNRSRKSEKILEHASSREEGWYSNVVRLPCQPIDIGGNTHGSNPEPPAFTRSELERYVERYLEPSVSLLESRGVYCIIDYHRHRWRDYTDSGLDEEIRSFWEIVAGMFNEHDNVIYELYNEPVGPYEGNPSEKDSEAVETWKTWRDTARPWLETLRTEDPDSLVIIGSPRWSQFTALAPDYEFDDDNVIYSGHCYVHPGLRPLEDYFGKPSREVPVIMSEWGYGSEGPEYLEGTTENHGRGFIEMLTEYDIHSVAWCFDSVWGPRIFDDEWNLLEGNRYHGGLVKEYVKDQNSSV
ncbi:MAG: glycoside hydrolase family 5 protein [Halobacteria archaeon]